MQAFGANMIDGLTVWKRPCRLHTFIIATYRFSRPFKNRTRFITMGSIYFSVLVDATHLIMAVLSVCLGLISWVTCCTGLVLSGPI